ncbi:MAG TPA: sulfotransferase [Actinocrinis sp.]|uniref:sulfotransferase family protein n=1 Tax=Actinocrinis sp. TaxID=1920516 RepID=UPI002DDD9B25|nr:sulfotransferase [Actinocrinis sp.]HEV2344944.1 sulfotransferase [Actinocrinis sp.]
MDVIGVGMGRTGTNSLKLALEELGFGPCYHMKEVMDRPERIKTWRRVLDGAQSADWDVLYGGYRSTVDWPGAYYWRELVDAYPKAKVILSVRDSEKWVDSMYKTILRWPLRRPNLIGRLMFTLLRVVAPPSMAESRMLDRVFDRTFQGRHFSRPEDRQIAIEAFERHNEDIKAYVSADRLLVYQVSEGWEPLCAFLGVPVPDKPFPRVNDAKEFQADIAGRIRKYTIQIAAGITATITVALGIAALTHVL